MSICSVCGNNVKNMNMKIIRGKSGKWVCKDCLQKANIGTMKFSYNNIPSDQIKAIINGENYEPQNNNMNSNKKQSGFICPHCHSNNVNVQAVTDIKTKHRGCFSWLCWIILAICTLGFILIIPALTNSKTKSKTHSEAVCQNCGHRWKV